MLSSSILPFPSPLLPSSLFTNSHSLTAPRPSFLRLESHLLHLLQSSGWTEDLRRLCEQRLRTGEARGYDDLVNSVMQEAEKMVDGKVRREAVEEVRKVLAGWVVAESSSGGGGGGGSG